MSNFFYTDSDIKNLDRRVRLKLINAVTGIKPGNLVGSMNSKGQTNLSVFSSVVHLGSDPALLGMIMRPVEEVPRHTYQNILETGYYTINHIHPTFVENAHYTSAKFDESISEFDRCGLTAEFLENFDAPFVKESTFKMGMQFLQQIEIPQNKTRLIIGEVKVLVLPEEARVDGDIDLEQSRSIGISGLNSYYELRKLATFPYARTNEVPDFDNGS
ncbi:flavin oxidoreductase [Robertkochia marina]|uniref:Flavin oxidoreductase n=1 Tax=Robertkochia marina TaxID=1227945 RepID=A0A4S3LYF3_9FLAO|nr:flavin reductase [Robertkochia marina]THD66456.1 flavin oxidoreductase [Robertkochia marina]TRZ44133.1 flavin oxidoreductase [Robertkochia marina]